MIYGYRKLADDLRDQGDEVSENRVARLTSLAGILAQFGCKRRPGRYGGKPAVIARTKLDRQFEVDAPDKVWVTDGTYFRTDEEWSSLSDLFPEIWTAPTWNFPVWGRVKSGRVTMKRSKFSAAQIAFFLEEGEGGTANGEIWRNAGISEATFSGWRKKYARLMPSEMRRLRQLEEENGEHRKRVSDLRLKKAMLQDVL